MTQSVIEDKLKTVLVTGATGFIGRALVAYLRRQHDICVVAAVRQLVSEFSDDIKQVALVEISKDTDWSRALVGVDVVVHCAARVHVMNESAADSAALSRKINVDGTLNLARQASTCGVKRFVFLSSMNVHGEQTPVGQPFHAAQALVPKDDFAHFKLEAEEELQALAFESDMEVVTIRPPLVYGPGVKANFRSMMSWVAKGVPLPLGAINNRRSLVSLDNLVDLVVRCIDHPAAANQVFLVSDGEDLSTSELLRRMARALGRPASLLPVPVFLLKLGATLLGKPGIAQRLCGNFQVDITTTCETLDWTPPVSVDDALARTAADFLSSRAKQKGK